MAEPVPWCAAWSGGPPCMAGAGGRVSDQAAWMVRAAQRPCGWGLLLGAHLKGGTRSCRDPNGRRSDTTSVSQLRRRVCGHGLTAQQSLGAGAVSPPACRRGRHGYDHSPALLWPPFQTSNTCPSVGPSAAFKTRFCPHNHFPVLLASCRFTSLHPASPPQALRLGRRSLPPACRVTYLGR